ncbi:MAG: hypothetical protein ACLR0N_10110 [Bilophila wadsworthia]
MNHIHAGLGLRGRSSSRCAWCPWPGWGRPPPAPYGDDLWYALAGFREGCS